MTIKDNDGTVIDISGGTTVFIFNEGSNAVLEPAGTDETDGTDGKTYYQVSSPTFYGSNVGAWTVYVQYTDSTSKVWMSSPHKFDLLAGPTRL